MIDDLPPAAKATSAEASWEATALKFSKMGWIDPEFIELLPASVPEETEAACVEAGFIFITAGSTEAFEHSCNHKSFAASETLVLTLFG